jgi:hypothetical protein
MDGTAQDDRISRASTLSGEDAGVLLKHLVGVGIRFRKDPDSGALFIHNILEGGPAAMKVR